MSHRTKVLAFWAALGCAVLWGYHSVAIRWLTHQGLDPFLIATLRLYQGTALLLVFLIFRKEARGKPLRERFGPLRRSGLFWILLLLGAANFITFHKGLQYTTATNMILLEAMMPATIMLYVLFFSRESLGDKIHNVKYMIKLSAAVLACIVGTYFLLVTKTQSSIPTDNMKWLGDLLAIAAMVSWALNTVYVEKYAKRYPEVPLASIVSMVLLSSALALTPFSDWSTLRFIGWREAGLLVILGLGSSGLATWLWYYAARHLENVVILALFFNLSVLFTVVVEIIFLDLSAPPIFFLGGAIVIVAATYARMLK